MDTTPGTRQAAASGVADNPPPPPPAAEYTPPAAETSSAPPRGTRPRRARGGIRRLINSSVRIADLQYRIWLTQAKLTLKRMLLYVGLFFVASLLGLLAVIFLYIGLFRVLTDVIGLRPVWAFLIFGGLHLVIAFALIMVGTSILGKSDDDDDDDKKKANPRNEPAPT